MLFRDVEVGDVGWRGHVLVVGLCMERDWDDGVNRDRRPRVAVTSVLL